MRRAQVLRYSLHAAMGVGLAFAATKYLHGATLWEALERFDFRYAPVIAFLSTAYVLVKARRFVVQMGEIRSVRTGALFSGYIASQACSLLPGGIALRTALLRQLGIPVEESAASFAVAALSDQLALTVCALLAALWLQVALGPMAVILTLTSVGWALLRFRSLRGWLRSRVENLMRKFHLLERWLSFLGSLRQVWTASLLYQAMLTALLACLLLVAALAVSVWSVGTTVPLPTLLLACSLPTMLGRLSGLPGGMGITEAGMISILDAAQGVTPEVAAAATLVFRAGTTLFGAGIGGGCYLWNWRRFAVPADGNQTKEGGP